MRLVCVDGERGGADLATLRDALLEQVSATLATDERVVGWGLVGSFGRGEADAWSDLDVLIATDDARFEEFVDRERNSSWRDADLFIDARRNVPVGAMSASTVHVTSGLPVWVDWYVYPHAMAAWPSDSLVRRGGEAVSHVDLAFRDWNGRGHRQAPLDVSAEARQLAHIAMVPIAGKYVARRSSAAQPMIEFLTGEAASAHPEAQLTQLRALVGGMGAGCPVSLLSAIRSHLSLVEAALA